MPIVDFFAFILRLIDGILVPLIFAIAFISFIWGIFRYFFNDNEEKRKEGRGYALAGIIGFFIMFSVWGLTTILVNTFGFDSATRPAIPFFDR